MSDRPAPPPRRERLLQLARRDRSAATRAMGAMSIDEQVAAVCGAPLSQRADVLALATDPEALVPALPDAELCFIVKAVGITDAGWILSVATPDQIVACIDLDAWSGDDPDHHALGEWMAALVESGEEALFRGVSAIDPELVVLFLKERIAVEMKPNDDQGWEPPVGSQTLAGQFYFTARKEGDDLADVVRLLRTLFERDYWTYFRMIQGVNWELPTENTHWALRWRTGRLEDLGFPPWDEAMSIYRFLEPASRANVPEEAHALDVSAWKLPVWLPSLPAAADDRHAIFRAIEGLDPDERQAAFFAFVAVANKIAVADKMTLSDATSVPVAIDKTARIASAGLEFVATEQKIGAVELLRRVPIERLFRVGANLDPEAARVRAMTVSE